MVSMEPSSSSWSSESSTTLKYVNRVPLDTLTTAKVPWLEPTAKMLVPSSVSTTKGEDWLSWVGLDPGDFLDFVQFSNEFPHLTLLGGLVDQDSTSHVTGHQVFTVTGEATCYDGFLVSLDLLDKLRWL
ncbi:hypothetical protein WICPIJ_008208 [Wickerhamomyces pijperi]|uniref:Uncharacterized protein n=1 Tax=Wickerhamomyces pijperi TaxID=599730 RepID=A0A9P8PYC7_WICPI|nr:hypothetical protein WICPIJ_008208 [Wickerhamomyces pijperi]